MGAEQNSFLFGANSTFIEELYARYIENPAAVDASWQNFFASLTGDQHAVLLEARGPSWQRDRSQVIGAGEAAAKSETTPAKATAGGASQAEVRAAAIDSVRALMLIRAYRIRGHLMANLDPLGLSKHEPHPELDPGTYGFADADWDRPIFINGVLGLEVATLREIMTIVQQTYCGTIGVEFMHIGDPA